MVNIAAGWGRAQDVLAKRRGLIDSVTQSLDELRKVNLWLSDDIANLLLKLANE